MKLIMINDMREYILVGGYPKKGEYQHPGGQVTATRLLVEYAKVNKIKLHIIDSSQNSFPATSMIKRFEMAKNRIHSLLKILREKEVYGVVIFSSSGFSFYEKIFMCLLTKLYDTKSFLFIRSGHFINLNEKNLIPRIFNKILLKTPTYIGAQGNKWLDFYEKMNTDLSKVKLIPNWIKINNNYSYSTNKESVVFLFVGLLTEKKGVLDLFDIIEEYDDLKQYNFRFAGNGKLFDQLQKRKQINNLLNVELIGWIEGEDLLYEYKNADILILPSYAEGFPNVILEALNYRLPIISTNVGGIPDSVINNYNGYTFEPGDKTIMYESIKKLGESMNKRIEFSLNCLDLLQKNHNFNQNCKKIFDTFVD